MRSIAQITVLAAILFGGGCAHQINITPPLNTLDAGNIAKIDKVVGYYISSVDRSKEVETPGGGGDRVKYLPYRESEPALKRVLSNVYSKVVEIPSLEDKGVITSNNVSYVFVPVVTTDSASDSAFTWPPTRFTVTIDCRAVDPAGATIWQTKVSGQGAAQFSEFRHDMSLSARRASRDAFLRLQQEISAAKELR